MEIGKIVGIAMNDVKAGEPLMIAVSGSGYITDPDLGEEIIKEKPKLKSKPLGIEFYKIEEELKNAMD